MICDFCNMPAIKGYDTPEFKIKDPHIGVVMVSEPGWAVCAECADFVDREDWSGLLVRNIEIEKKRFGRYYCEELTDCLKETHKQFRLHFNHKEKSLT